MCNAALPCRKELKGVSIPPSNILGYFFSLDSACKRETWTSCQGQMRDHDLQRNTCCDQMPSEKRTGYSCAEKANHIQRIVHELEPIVIQGSRGLCQQAGDVLACSGALIPCAVHSIAHLASPQKNWSIQKSGGQETVLFQLFTESSCIPEVEQVQLACSQLTNSLANSLC
jgi:hypothetical protein